MLCASSCASGAWRRGFARGRRTTSCWRRVAARAAPSSSATPGSRPRREFAMSTISARLARDDRPAVRLRRLGRARRRRRRRGVALLRARPATASSRSPRSRARRRPRTAGSRPYARYLTDEHPFRLGDEELAGADAFLERAAGRRPRAADAVARCLYGTRCRWPRPRRVPASSIDACCRTHARVARLAAEEVCALRSAPTLELGAAADRRRQALHPDGVVTYIIDRNVNYTNVCVTRCKFCNFYRTARRQDEGYVLSREVLAQKFQETVDLGGVQILLQGGLNPELPLELLRGSLPLDEGELPARPSTACRPRRSATSPRSRTLPIRDGARAAGRGRARLAARRRRRDPRRRRAPRISPLKCSTEVAGGHARGHAPGAAHDRHHGVRLRRDAAPARRPPRAAARAAGRDRRLHRLHLLALPGRGTRASSCTTTPRPCATCACSRCRACTSTTSPPAGVVADDGPRGRSGRRCASAATTSGSA